MNTSGQFHQHFTCSFYMHRAQKHNKTVKSSSFYSLLGSAHIKAKHKHVDEMERAVNMEYGNIENGNIEFCQESGELKVMCNMLGTIFLVRLT